MCVRSHFFEKVVFFFSLLRRPSKLNHIFLYLKQPKLRLFDYYPDELIWMCCNSHMFVRVWLEVKNTCSCGCSPLSHVLEHKWTARSPTCLQCRWNVQVRLPSRVRRLHGPAVPPSGWELPSTPSIWLPSIRWARPALCSLPHQPEHPDVPGPTSGLSCRSIPRTASSCWASRSRLPQPPSHAPCHPTYHPIRCNELW